jgi:hypothetical protein
MTYADEEGELIQPSCHRPINAGKDLRVLKV